MRKLIVVACLVFGAGILAACELAANGAKSVAGTAVAADKGCSVIGVWSTSIGETPPDLSKGEPPLWISTETGMSAASGVIVTDVPNWPNLPFFGLFPEVVRVTELKGVWERTSGNTFAFTQIGWGVDANGNPLYIVRNSGTSTLTDDCNTKIVKSSMEWFCTPMAERCQQGQDGRFAAPLPDMTGHRLTVTPPEWTVILPGP